MNAYVLQIQIIGANGHRTQECRADPVRKLQHGVVLAMAEKRQLGTDAPLNTTIGSFR